MGESIRRWAALALLAGVVMGAPPATAAQRKQLTRAQVDRMLRQNNVAQIAVLSAAGPATIQPGAAVTLNTDALLAARVPGEAVAVTAGDNLEYALPFRLGRVDVDAAALDLGVVVIVEGGGVDFRPDRGLYVGSVLIGVRAEGEAGPAQPLPRGVSFQVVIEPGEVTPDRIQIQHTGQPFVRVESLARALERGQQVRLRVIPDFSDGEDLDLPVRRPRLHLAASPPSIPGLGLGRSRITVTAARAIADAIGEVSLRESQGTLEPPTLSIDAGGVGTTELRSSGIGVARIEIASQDLDADSVEVRFTWPVAFLVAALAGGVIGGFVARYRATNPRTPLDAALRGASVGIVATVAYAATVNLVGGIDVGTFFNEGAVFAIAAIAAIWGLFRPGGVALGGESGS